MNQYASTEYWNDRYERDKEFFDWYQNWSGLQSSLTEFLKPSYEILIVGCGRSKLSEELYEQGYKNQTNIDVSHIAIEAMREIYKEKPRMKFEVMDVKDMKILSSNQFDLVIDKGTLDAVLCGNQSTQNAHQMLKEINRVLKDEGKYICITYGEPSFRLLYLDKLEFNWTVTVKNVQKATLAARVTLSTEQRDAVHYIYICSKNTDNYQPVPLSS